MPPVTIQHLEKAVDDIADSIYDLETEHGFAIDQVPSVGVVCNVSGPISVELQHRCVNLGSKVHGSMLGLLPPMVSISSQLLPLAYTQRAEVIIKLCAELIAAGASLTVQRLEEAVAEISTNLYELETVHGFSNRVEAAVPIQTAAAYIRQLNTLSSDIVSFLLNKMMGLQLSMLSINDQPHLYRQHARVIIQVAGGVLTGLHPTGTNGVAPVANP